jgi:hypothetical protein
MHNVYLTPDALLSLDLTTFLSWCDEVGLDSETDWDYVSAEHHEANHILRFSSPEVAMLFRLRFNV